MSEYVIYEYDKKNRNKIVNNLKDISEDKVLIFRKQKDLNRWLKENSFIN